MIFAIGEVGISVMMELCQRGLEGKGMQMNGKLLLPELVLMRESMNLREKFIKGKKALRARG